MESKELTDYTWEDVVSSPVGFIFNDTVEDNGLRFIILRGPCALCAYVGVPLDHPLAGKCYDDMPAQAHGGLTFAEKGNGKYLPEGRFWYGWDYAHCDDAAVYKGTTYRNEGKEWTPAMVKADSWGTLYEFDKLARLAVSIARA